MLISHLFMIFVVFDQSPLTLWINYCLYIYICCFDTNFSVFHSTFSGNLKRVNDDFHFQNDGLLHFHALLFGPSFSCPTISCPAIAMVPSFSCPSFSDDHSLPRCQSLLLRADLSISMFSTPAFLTVPRCPLL